jgi:hypothetical protein
MTVRSGCGAVCTLFSSTVLVPTASSTVVSGDAPLLLLPIPPLVVLTLMLVSDISLLLLSPVNCVCCCRAVLVVSSAGVCCEASVPVCCRDSNSCVQRKCAHQFSVVLELQVHSMVKLFVASITLWSAVTRPSLLVLSGTLGSLAAPLLVSMIVASVMAFCMIIMLL